MNPGRKLHPLHVAIIQGDVEKTREILEEGGDAFVNVSDNQGNTPLHYCGDTEMARLLLEAGAEPHQRNHRMDRPIDLMRRRGVPDNLINYMNHICGTSDNSRTKRGDIYNDIYTDLGGRNILALFIVVLAISAAFAYVFATLYSSELKEITIDDFDHYRVEL